MKLSKKLLTSIILVIGLLLISISPVTSKVNSQDILTEQEKVWLNKNSKKLTIVPLSSYPPIDFLDNDVQKGLTTDIINMIEKKLNFKIQRVYHSSWLKMVSSVKDGEIDIIASIQNTAERRKYFNFTESYATVPKVLIGKNNREDLVNLKSFKNKKVGIIKGYTLEKFLKEKVPSIQIVFVKDNRDGFYRASFGEIDAFVTDTAVASYYIEKYAISNLKVVSGIGFNWNLSIATSKNIPILNTILSKGLSLISEDEREEIYNKWININLIPFYKTKEFFYIIITSFSVIFVIILSFLFWNRTLKHQIKKRTEELEEHKNNLELLVHERTEKLEDIVDELTKTKNHLVESEKMAALGALVAGVAHEINTPVGIGVTGITHLNEMTKNINKIYTEDEISKEEFEEYLENALSITTTVYTNLKRAAQLVKSFKQISVDQVSEEKREFHLNEYINETILSLQNIQKKTNIDIHVECSEKIKINTYPGAYSQIITNLIMNSIIHGYKKNEAGIISIGCSIIDNNLNLIYCDDGCGIKKENLNKIFNPFFTTNRKNGGSGLGLNIVYNIVTQKLHGTIECESEEKKGIKFTIVLPLN